MHWLLVNSSYMGVVPMILTTRHFILIAAAIKELDLGKRSKKKVIDGFIDMCSGVNPRFDEAVFRAACNEGGKP